MLKVIAHQFIKPESLELVRPLFQELVEKTRKEPLCLSYDLFIDQEDAGHFIFVEEWPDRAALTTHSETEHFTRLIALITPHRRQESSLLLMDAFPMS